MQTLPGRSCFYFHDDEALLCEEAYRIRNGIPELLTLDGECVSLSDIE